MNTKIRLNASQLEIVYSEQASQNTAINTVSVKLRLHGIPAAQAQAAVDTVLTSADVFTAGLSCENGEWFFTPGEKSLLPCELLPLQTPPEADEYVKVQDALRLAYPEELYRAQALPLSDGTVLVYIRFHHILIDGYGMSLFAQRILDCLAGKQLAPSSFFTAHSAPGHTSAGDAAFWSNSFEGSEAEASVYQDAEGDYTKSVYREQQPESLTRRIEAFARKNGVTVPYVLFSAYALYLAEATGKNEAVVLLPRLNRAASERETVGCYTLLIPVRICLDENESFAALCQRAMRTAQEASLHKGTGYGSILQATGASAQLSNYVFNFYRYALHSDIPHELDISVAGAMRNHLTWTVFRSANGLSYSYDLRNSIYTAQRATYFSESIALILKAGLQNAQLKDIPIIGKTEKKALLQVRGKQAKLSDTETIPSLFAKAVKKYAGRPAVYAGDRSLTFAELDRLSDTVAAGLTARGIKSGDSVAFMLPRDIRLIPTMFGILKSGAAFIPVDPAYPADRIRYILENSEAATLVSTASVAANAGRAYLEIDELTAAKLPFNPPDIPQGQTAYMIYTSGTTGKPKGVMLSHRGIINIARPDNNPFSRDITRNCHGLTAIGSICFDISLFEIFVPLMNGLFIELGNEKSMLDADELADTIMRHGADTLHCTPSRLAVYLGKPKFSEAVRKVKAILSAGEVLPQSLVDELKNHYGIRIYNGYGPTETTIGATITEAGDNKTIGKPIGNSGILILNNRRKLVPYGAIGEICIYGDGVGLGYRKREEETRAKFLPWEGRRLYRTGDLGHLTETGELIYHGRNDRQIKLRGLRIELSEIEHVLGSFPGVLQANCIVRKLGQTEHLVGFYTADKAQPVDADALKAHIKKSLTAYMVPDILKELEAMPQTPGGKTDLRALAEVPVELIKIYRAPQTHTETVICQAFATVLHADNIGLDDNFFELGGDSLRCVEVMLEIEKLLELTDSKLEYTDIYRYPTPDLLAKKLEDEGQDEEAAYDIASLCYDGIPELLSQPAPDSVKKRSLGNVLLTGATGYLGIHILIELLRSEGVCDHIYCLSRPNKRLTAQKRVRNTLFYYAEEDFYDLYGSKWSVIEGDITDAVVAEQGLGVSIDTIINSAANVAHFAYGDKLTRINVGGVKNLIALALREKAELCQISTISVGGVYKRATDKVFTEKDLYIGQEIYNEYIYTKYMAEYAMLRAAVDDGLHFKIMRVGNLQGRRSDGEFQMNMKSNAFTRQLTSYAKMGLAPASVYEASVNFSPIDDTAHMIIALTQSDAEDRIYHVYPPYEVPYSKMFAVLKDMGLPVKVLPDEDFNRELNRLKHSEEGKSLVEGLLTERPGGEYIYYPVTQERTLAALVQLHESWTPVTDEYLGKYLEILSKMDMF